MNSIGAYVFVIFIFIIIIYGLTKHVDVYDCFITGAKSGIKSAISILPALVTIFVAISIFKSSGLLTYVCEKLSFVTEMLGFPKEVLPICFLSPISGSGALTVYENVISEYGPDSFIGRVASVISGSTETTFYAITVYYGAIGIKKTRHTVLCSLCADFTSFLLASVFTKLFFY